MKGGREKEGEREGGREERKKEMRVGPPIKGKEGREINERTEGERRREGK